MQEHQSRLRAAIAEQGLDAALVVSPASVCHATGAEAFLPLDAGTELAKAPTFALVPAASDEPARLVVPESHAGRARQQAEGAVVDPVPTFGHFDPVDARQALVTTTTKAWHELGKPRRIGYEPQWLPRGLVALAGLDGEVELVDGGAALAQARMVKSAWEIDRIRRAVAAADAAQELLAAEDLAGRNELELWGALVGACAGVAGHEVTVFADLVSGPRTGTLTYPGGPIDRVIEAGDSVILDVSVRVDGYWADCTSTVVAGGAPSADQLYHYHASRDAFDAAIACLQPGRRAREAEQAARGALRRHAVQPAHYAGHQIGCAVNEPPRLVPYDDTMIEPGMVFAVEPGSYDPPGGVGARSEKVVLVTADGLEVVSGFAWPLDDLM